MAYIYDTNLLVLFLIRTVYLIIGLCRKATKNEIKNRYCNLFPFDRNLVSLEKEEDYINASWIELPRGKIYYIKEIVIFVNENLSFEPSASITIHYFLFELKIRETTVQENTLICQKIKNKFESM